MRASILVAACVLAAATMPVLAQTGEVDPASSRAAPSTPATPAEKAQARQDRRTEGAKASKSTVLGDAQPGPAGTARKATKQQRKEAAAKRRQEAATALKQGQISSGEK